MKQPFALLTIACILGPLALPAQVLDTRHLTEPELSEGQCHTVVDSKVYLKDLKSPNANKKAIQEIGDNRIAQLSNSADESYYFCKIKCILQSETQYLWLTQKDKNENFKNMNGFVCSGLDIQDVALSSTLTIKTTVAVPFSAVQSRFPDVHTKLKSISYKLNGTPAVGSLLIEFFNTLSVLQNAYSLANSEMFHAAATRLKIYLPSSPDSWLLIKEKVKTLEETHAEFQPGIANIKTGDDIVTLFFLNNGLFLRYID